MREQRLGPEVRCVMDFPQAWKFVARTELKDHDPRCSYAISYRGMLCDCFILWNEYERRKAAELPN